MSANERVVTDLLRRPDLWQGNEQLAPCPAGIASGFNVLDENMPGSGWPIGALTEILLARQGIGELQLLMPALARLSQQGRWIAWIAPPYIPYAPALAAQGINLSRLLLVHPKAHTDGLWAVEQALRAGTCGAVLAWMAANDLRSQRRLQLAAEAGNSAGFLFRDEQTAMRTSYAALRLRLEPANHGLTVQVLKRRGGWASGPLPIQLHALSN